VLSFDHPHSAPQHYTGRFAVRFRDENDGLWVAKPGDMADGIQLFMIVLPSEVTSVVPEVVLLKPVTAEFQVLTTP